MHKRARSTQPSSLSPTEAGALGDTIDQHMAAWRVVRPDLDYTPFDVVSRLRRVREHIDGNADSVVAAFGLTMPVFKVLASLRRQNPPFRLSQRALMDHLGLTSGTISARVDQVVALGLVSREPDPTDKRSSQVQLTEAGLAAYDACAPAYLAVLDRLLSALDQAERATLTDLLRRLELSFEGEVEPYPPDSTPLGVSLSPAHTTREMQRSLGLPECAGLLVRAVETSSPAWRAGVCVGDVLVRIDTHELRSILTLASALAACESDEVWIDTRRGLEERRVLVRLNT